MKKFILCVFLFNALLYSNSGARNLNSLAPEFFTESAKPESCMIFVYDDAGFEKPLNQSVFVKKIKIPLKENKRLVAFTLTVLLGPFGVHRLYLGTQPIVPIAYTLTLGGGLGIIPLIDAGLILFTKDLSKLENNPNFFLWSK